MSKVQITVNIRERKCKKRKTIDYKRARERIRELIRKNGWQARIGNYTFSAQSGNTHRIVVQHFGNEVGFGHALRSMPAHLYQQLVS